ncbi:MAG: hypothetical protein QM831_30190 [Kofleriaceae bacterium]
MDTLTYTFKIQGPAKSPAVIVAGGADSNRDGVISNADEVAALQTTDSSTWTRTQNVAGATSGMAFAVHFTVGVGVPWQLTIANAAGTTLFSAASTTIWAFDTVSYIL